MAWIKLNTLPIWSSNLPLGCAIEIDGINHDLPDGSPGQGILIKRYCHITSNQQYWIEEPTWRKVYRSDYELIDLQKCRIAVLKQCSAGSREKLRGSSVAIKDIRRFPAIALTTHQIPIPVFHEQGAPYCYWNHPDENGMMSTMEIPSGWVDFQLTLQEPLKEVVSKMDFIQGH